MKITTPNYNDTKQRQFLDNTHQALSGHLTLGDNLSGELIKNVTIHNAPTSIQHNLGYVPVGFMVINKYGAGHIWRPAGSEWNIHQIFLEGDVAGFLGSGIKADIFIYGGR